ncbi:hypothetical protein [Desulfurivibrio dismutans]|uniref:hypothetical protein n=1 Tax=Desulfurivibrio dismutans TaxID=1398908 RepID=UPI0023DC5B2C|nr:hypothetical protein [Desulfurivibrio alkaliphilus]MDF1615779.1 hypothetical protein [Desulfurivibrio alkaliphilus]
MIVFLVAAFIFGGFLNSALAQVRVLELRNSTSRSIDILIENVDLHGRTSTVYVAGIAPQRKWEQNLPIPVGRYVLLKYGDLPLSALEAQRLRIPPPYGNEGVHLRWKVIPSPAGGNGIRVVYDE